MICDGDCSLPECWHSPTPTVIVENKPHGEPPEGWFQFGEHAVMSRVPSLRLSDEVDAEDGLPLWETHVDYSCCSMHQHHVDPHQRCILR